MRPNYNLLYKDMLLATQPEKLADTKMKRFFENPKTALDLVNINLYINNETKAENDRIKSYDEPSIIEILTYQAQNNLSNTETSKLYNISMPTVRKWKKFFSNQLMVLG